MANLGNFNANDFEEYTSGGSPVPAGKYQVTIDMTEKEDMKSGNGQKLVITYVIIAGEYQGRKLYDYLNLWHATSPDAQKIAAQQLATIMRRIGKNTIQDSDELVGGTLMVDVELAKDNGSDKKFNRVYGYPAADNGAPPAPPFNQTPPPGTLPGMGTPDAPRTLDSELPWGTRG